MAGFKPKFGDRLRGIWASESNPQRDGFYVETIIRRGRMNAGTGYRITDGKGEFWEYPKDSVILLERANPDRPEIVCLCGSSRFVGEMAVIRWELEKEGKIVLGLNLLPDWYEGLSNDHQAETEGIAEQMDALHLEKIRVSDKVLIVNIGGYIGDSTRREIEFTKSIGKPVAYIESKEVKE